MLLLSLDRNKRFSQAAESHYCTSSSCVSTPFKEFLRSVLHIPDNAIRKVASFEFLLGLSHSFNFQSLLPALVSSACSKMLMYGTEKQKKPDVITLIAVRIDLLLWVFVSWNVGMLWKIQDESTVVLDKYGLRCLFNNKRIPLQDRETLTI